MNERIKKILEELGLKKVEFAERLHISRPYASELCSGAKAPSDRTISDICREFGVREAWLRTGEGEMFVQDTQSEQVAAFLADLVAHPIWWLAYTHTSRSWRKSAFSSSFKMALM